MNITVEQIITFILGLSAILGALGGIIAVIVKLYGKTVGKSIEKSVDPIKKELNSFKNDLQISIDKQHEQINKRLDSLDASECRNFLVRFLGDIERGVDIDPVEIQRAYEVKEHYENDLKLNSYIHDRWSSVMGNRSLAASLKKYSKK